MVTREEQHSTRGRAHLLFEMLQREGPFEDGWRDEAVKESLDLCLACKGCKGDCPVNVDIATYKAEFLSHYYDGSPPAAAARTRSASSTGGRGSRRIAPGLVNLLDAAARARRRSPRSPPASRPRSGRSRAFAAQTFQCWFRAAGATPAAAPRRGRALGRHLQQPLHVRETAQAAVDVLEDAGFRGRRPARPPLLRPAALRLRDARPREALPRATCSPRSRDAHRGAGARRRARAELLLGVPRRALRPPARRATSATNAARELTCTLSELLGRPRPRSRGSPRLGRGPSCRGTATTRRSCTSTPRRRARRDGARPRGARLGVLRDGRLVRLREGQVRRLDGVRRARAPAARARRRAPTRSSSPTGSRAGRRSPTRARAARSTSPRPSSGRSRPATTAPGSTSACRPTWSSRGLPRARRTPSRPT